MMAMVGSLGAVALPSTAPIDAIGISVDSTSDHEAWARDIEETQGAAPNYPIIGDADYAISKVYGMLPADVEGDPKARTPADNQTVRTSLLSGRTRGSS